MRYLVAAALAAVLVLPPANVQAGPATPPFADVFVIIGAREVKGNLVNEFAYCGDLTSPNLWTLIVFEEGGTVDLAYVGDGAKVSGKGGVKMKDKGAAQLLDFPEPVRPGRGPTTTDVSVKMSASFKTKTLAANAQVADNSNGVTVAIDSPIKIHLTTNLLLEGGCQELIDELTTDGAAAQTVRELMR